jgi:hypothetical protein
VLLLHPIRPYESRLLLEITLLVAHQPLARVSLSSKNRLFRSDKSPSTPALWTKKRT